MSKEIIEEDVPVTKKGTLTLPVKIRRILALPKEGSILKIRFSSDTKEGAFFKPKDFDELQKITAKHIRKDRQPLLDVNSYYSKRAI